MTRFRSPTAMEADLAEAVGLAALAFLAEDRARLDRFLSLTGLPLERLRAEAGEPATLAAVLEHLLADESLLMVFAASSRFSPDDIAPAAASLSRLTEKRRRP